MNIAKHEVYSKLYKTLIARAVRRTEAEIDKTKKEINELANFTGQWAVKKKASKEVSLAKLSDKLELALKGLRRCSSCKEVKNWFDFAIKASVTDGVNGYCRVCANAAVKKSQSKRAKVCPCCKNRKPIHSFYSVKNTADGYSVYCKACAIQKAKNSRIACAEYRASKEVNNA